jgi:hypothetical protein
MRPPYRLASQMLSLAIGAVALACARSPEGKTLRSDTAHGDIFTEQSVNVAYGAVDSIFQSRCVECHSGTEPAHGVDLSSYESVMHGREGHGPIVQVGNPAGSVLIDVMRSKGDRPAHVRAQNRFTNADLATIASWIADGAQPLGTDQEQLTATLRLYVVALNDAQNSYHARRKRYASSTDSLHLIPVAGVNISFVHADTSRWEATVAHPQLAEFCVVGGKAREGPQQIDLATAAQFCSAGR